MMTSASGERSRTIASRMTSRAAGSMPEMGSSSRNTLASRDIASAICTFSRMPFDSVESFAVEVRPKNRIRSRAFSSLKSAKKSRYWLTQPSMVELSARKLASGRNETSALLSGPGACPWMRTVPS